MQAVGQIDDARRAYEAAIDLAPHQTASYLGLGDYKRYTKGDPHLTAIEALAREADKLPEGEQTNVHFALARRWRILGSTPAR